MILADTSIWIEFLRQRSPVSPLFRDCLEGSDVVSLECIFGELLQGAKNVRERKIIRSYWEAIPKIPFENIWIQAGEYSSQQNLLNRGIGLLDAVIIVAGKKAGAKIWTLDKKLRSILPSSERFDP